MTTLVRWEPFRELSTLHSEMSRLMNGLLEGNGRTSQSWVPALDVWETDDELVYAFDLPGIPEDRISLELNDDTLTVSAERAQTDEVKGDRFYRFERRFGTFSRAVGLPQGTDESKVKAEYSDGVLEVRVAKPEVQKPRRIQIGGSEQPTIEGSATQA
jgi:HSP20 family protein